jgi:hypothetical protein
MNKTQSQAFNDALAKHDIPETGTYYENNEKFAYNVVHRALMSLGQKDCTARYHAKKEGKPRARYEKALRRLQQ